MSMKDAFEEVSGIESFIKGLSHDELEQILIQCGINLKGEIMDNLLDEIHLQEQNQLIHDKCRYRCFNRCKKNK